MITTPVARAANGIAALAFTATMVTAAIVYSGVMSFVLLKLVGLVYPLRASQGDEAVGLDVCLHREEAYVHAGGSGSPAQEAVSR